METESPTAGIEAAPGFAKNPEYQIILEKPDREFVATLEGVEIARSHQAIVLREGGHPPVVYFPPTDVQLKQAHLTDKDTYCPYKGIASYWTFGTEKNIAWSYEEPFREMLDIKGYISFYVNRLDDSLL